MVIQCEVGTTLKCPKKVGRCIWEEIVYKLYIGRRGVGINFEGFVDSVQEVL